MNVASPLVTLAGAAEAQQKALSIDTLYDPDARVDFSGTPPTDITWVDEAHFIYSKAATGSGQEPRARGREWVKVEGATGRTSPLFDVGRMEQALASLLVVHIVGERPELRRHHQVEDADPHAARLPRHRP